MPGREERLRERRACRSPPWTRPCAISPWSCSRPMPAICAASWPKPSSRACARPASIRSTSPGAARSRRVIPTTGACTARSRSIEYDNTQNNANHIHSVWHDLDQQLRPRPPARALRPRPRPRVKAGALNGSDPTGPICRTDWPAFSLARPGTEVWRPAGSGSPDRRRMSGDGGRGRSGPCGDPIETAQPERRRYVCAAFGREAGLDGSGGQR